MDAGTSKSLKLSSRVALMTVVSSSSVTAGAAALLQKLYG
jgi:hypothetical protein